MDYLVKSGEFEGPVHILLDLIQDRKLHVSEVSLAQVTEDFLTYLSDHSLSHGQISSFIIVASTLVLIKAKSLLPKLELTEEEETSIVDLTARVRQYQVVQKYATYLLPMYQKQVLFERIWQDKTPVFAPDPQISVETLQELLESLLISLPIPEQLPEKEIKAAVRLEEVIDTLTHRIQSGVLINTKDIMEKYRNASDPSERRQAKVFAVVSFLAILELVKKGIGSVLQQESFSDIVLSTSRSDGYVPLSEENPQII